MQQLVLCGWLALCLGGCGGGEVVAVKFVHPDGEASNPNPSAHYTCQPAEGATFACRSGQSFHQYDRVLEAGALCQYGVASVYVEASGSGKVTRIQYVCATPRTGGFPPDPAPVAPASGTPPPGGV